MSTAKREAKAQRPDQMSPTLDPVAGVVKIEYQVRDSAGEFVRKDAREYYAADLPQSVKDMCLLYGISKKLADSTSSGKALGIMGSAKLDWMDEIWKNLCAGDWNMKRTGGGSNTVDIYLAMVVADLKKISVDAATLALQAFDKDKREELAAKYKDLIDAKRREAREAEKVDLSDL